MPQEISLLRPLVALLAIGAISVSAWRMHQPLAGLLITPLQVGATPATLFARSDAAPGPAVVIRATRRDRRITATVAVSMFSPVVTAAVAQKPARRGG